MVKNYNFEDLAVDGIAALFLPVPTDANPELPAMTLEKLGRTAHRSIPDRHKVARARLAAQKFCHVTPCFSAVKSRQDTT